MFGLCFHFRGVALGLLGLFTVEIAWSGSLYLVLGLLGLVLCCVYYWDCLVWFLVVFSTGIVRFGSLLCLLLGLFGLVLCCI